VVQFDNAAGTRARYAAMRLAAPDDSEAAVAHVGGGDEHMAGFVARVLLDRLAPVPEGGLLVDVGCGAGRLARYLTDRPIDYVGTDIVPEVLATAAAVSRRQDWRFLAVDGPEIPVEPDSVDVVFANGVFTNVLPEVSFQLVKAAARVLKPGGRMLATYFDAGWHEARLRDYLAALDRRHEPIGFLTYQLVAIMADLNGLEVERLQRPEYVQLQGQLLDGRTVDELFNIYLFAVVFRKPLGAHS
jgi:SAM-dependent methyltransferase